MTSVHIPKRTYTLIFVEGDTEVVFYKRIKQIYFSHCPAKIINLKGNWNINQKILDKASRHLEDNTEINFFICICIDRESRKEKAPIRLNAIKKSLESDYKNIKKNDIKLYLAVQDIESWFLHDMDSIYKFLKIPKNKRNPQKFPPVEKFNHTDLSKVFKMASRYYKKGNDSGNFIDNLDLKLIRSKADVLDNFCKFMESKKVSPRQKAIIHVLDEKKDRIKKR